METMTYQHLGTWTRDDGNVAFRVDLWDTGETNGFGNKSKLRYAFAVIPPPIDSRPVVFDGEDYFPAPSIAIDSNECAGALLSFFSAYGESIRYGSDDVPEFTKRQREALADYGEEIGLWSFELEGEGE